MHPAPRAQVPATTRITPPAGQPTQVNNRRPGSSRHPLAVNIPNGALGTIGIGHGAWAMFLAVLPLAGVLVTTGPCQSAMAVAFTVLELAGVIVAVCMRHEAMAIGLAVLQPDGVLAATRQE